ARQQREQMALLGADLHKPLWVAGRALTQGPQLLMLLGLMIEQVRLNRRFDEGMPNTHCRLQSERRRAILQRGVASLPDWRRIYSTLAPERATILPHLVISDCTNLCSSSGAALTTGLMPCSTSFPFTSARAMIALISPCSLATIAPGVPDGATNI